MTTDHEILCEVLDTLQALLCDPSGRVGIVGSPADNSLLNSAVAALRGVVERTPGPTQFPGWQPIATAPKDNKRVLYVAKFNADGRLVELGYNAQWTYWEESRELSHINGYYWENDGGSEDPTHWAYQNEAIPKGAPEASVQSRDKRKRSLCSICYEPQFSTPAGRVCSNGHGGAPSTDE